MGLAGSELVTVEQRFHTLIQLRLEEFQLPLPTELPRLKGLKATEEAPAWFAVAGMYGGFAYYLKPGKVPLEFVVASWSRVCDGSGQRHLITADRTELVEEGFV